MVARQILILHILAITENKLKPVLVEPSIETYNIDPLLIEHLITPRTRGIMIVHLYGQNSMTDSISELAARPKLVVIEDNAQAQGCFFMGKRTGSLADAAGHSFYPGRIWECRDYVITTNNENLPALSGNCNYG